VRTAGLGRGRGGSTAADRDALGSSACRKSGSNLRGAQSLISQELTQMAKILINGEDACAGGYTPRRSRSRSTGKSPWGTRGDASPLVRGIRVFPPPKALCLVPASPV
jgi:hypothetical protein